MYVELLTDERMPDIPLGVIRLFGVTKRGREYLCVCPFHKEKTPSFTFNEFNYKCLGCGASGDVHQLAIETKELDMTIETKQCQICLESPPYDGCAAKTGDETCAQLVMYRAAMLPAAPDYPDLCKDVAGVEWVPKSKYDDLRAYASRLSVDLSLLNGIITRAAQSAQRYVEIVERGAS